MRSTRTFSKRALVHSHALLAFASVVLGLAAAAQAEPPAAPASASLDPRPQDAGEERDALDSNPLEPAARANDETRGLEDPTAFDESLLDYGLQIRLPRPADDLLGQVTLARTVRGSHIVRYRGLQGFIVRRMRRLYYKRFRNSLRDQIDAGGLDHFQIAARYRAMGEAEADLARGGRWWERTWLDSLTAERGGAPAEPVVTEIGERTTVLSLGPLSISNDFRARLDGTYFGLGVDPSPSRVFRDLGDAARDAATYARQFGDEDEGFPDRRAVDEDEDEEPRELRHPDRPRLSTSDLFDLSVEAQVPDPDLGWRLRVRPEARVRLRPGKPIKARVGFRACLEFSMGPPRARQRVLEFVSRVRYDLYKRELVATLQVQFVAW